MPKEKQDKYRADLIDNYNQKAWECFANYQYIGSQYEIVNKQVEQAEKNIKTTEASINEIMATPDHHTKENRDKVKVLRSHIIDLQEQIKTVSPTAKKLYEEMTSWQAKGSHLMNTAEFMETFKINTPEEIKENAEKKAKELEKTSATTDDIAVGNGSPVEAKTE